MLPQLEEKIYSLVPELFQCDIDEKGTKSYYPIEIKHWLPLLGGLYTLNGNGFIYTREGLYLDYEPMENEIQYDFKKSFKEQSPEFHEWLLSQIP